MQNFSPKKNLLWSLTIFRVIFLSSCLLLFSEQSSALKIVINNGQEGYRSIAIVPFYKIGTNIQIEKIIKNDLLLSGLFRTVANNKMPNQPKNIKNIKFKNWRPLADSMIIGSMVRIAGVTKITIELIDIFKKSRLVSYRYNLKHQTPKQVRKVAHKLSDLIYQKLTGRHGIFTTKLTYVSVINKGYDKIYSLDISGIDGKDSVSIFKSQHPILSPTWSPNGKQIAFVSFQNNKAEIWIKNLKTNKLYLAFNFQGNISSPSFSPNGDKLAVTLVKDGNAEIYIINLLKQTAIRITKDKNVDTEATWSHDGKKLYFLSDRYKKQAQIYTLYLDHPDIVSRVTQVGQYNTSPDISPDGKYLVLLHRIHGKYKVSIQNIHTKQFRIISKTNADEAPSFSPNSDMIVYASKQKNRGIITITNVFGTVHQVYSSGNSDIREPAWSPYLK